MKHQSRLLYEKLKAENLFFRFLIEFILNSKIITELLFFCLVRPDGLEPEELNYYCITLLRQALKDVKFRNTSLKPFLIKYELGYIQN